MNLLPDDPMAVLALANDVILERIVTNDGGRVLYICLGDCSCMFWPCFESDYVYPDRFAHVRSDGSHCDDDSKCGCHNFPYCTASDPLSDNSTVVLSKDQVA